MFTGVLFTGVGGCWTHDSRGEWAGTHLPRKGGVGRTSSPALSSPAAGPSLGCLGERTLRRSGILPLGCSPCHPWSCYWAPFPLLGVLLAPISHLLRAGPSCLGGPGRPRKVGVKKHSSPLESMLPCPWAQPGMSAPCALLQSVSYSFLTALGRNG